MKNYLKHLPATAIAVTLFTTALTGIVSADPTTSSVKLLTANFDARQVVQVEVGDFHFKPGQIAPIHTHAAPAVGYVAKGSIIYQVEGEKPQILKEGDAFFEPINKRILRFDNASATHEAIFLDFNLEKAGEPFIVFEKPPTEAIDRRTLPTTKLSGNGKLVDQVDIHSKELAGNSKLQLNIKTPTFGIVAQGEIELQLDGGKNKRYSAGETFSLTSTSSKVTIANTSAKFAAKVITFQTR